MFEVVMIGSGVWFYGVRSGVGDYGDRESMGGRGWCCGCCG